MTTKKKNAFTLIPYIKFSRLSCQSVGWEVEILRERKITSIVKKEQESITYIFKNNFAEKCGLNLFRSSTSFSRPQMY